MCLTYPEHRSLSSAATDGEDEETEVGSEDRDGRFRES